MSSKAAVCGEGGVWAEMTVVLFNVLGRMVYMYSWWLGRGCSYIGNTSAAWWEEEKWVWEAVSGRALSHLSVIGCSPPTSTL